MRDSYPDEIIVLTSFIKNPGAPLSADAPVYNPLIQIPHAFAGMSDVHRRHSGSCAMGSGPRACVPPSQVSPVTGSLHEHRLTQLQLRT